MQGMKVGLNSKDHIDVVPLVNNITTVNFRGRKRKVRVLSENEIIPEGSYYSSNNGHTWFEVFVPGDTVKEHQVITKRIYMVLID